jgi:hypothetical protein
MASTPSDTTTLCHENRSNAPLTPPLESRACDVNIIQAKKAFGELSRQLTKQSESVSQSSPSTASGNDIEKGLDPYEGTFDLREYLTSSNDANQQAGIKHKVVTSISSGIYAHSNQTARWSYVGGSTSGCGRRFGQQGNQ